MQNLIGKESNSTSSSALPFFLLTSYKNSLAKKMTECTEELKEIWNSIHMAYRTKLQDAMPTELQRENEIEKLFLQCDSQIHCEKHAQIGS